MLTELSIDEYSQSQMKLLNKGNIYHSFQSKKEDRVTYHQLKLEELIIKLKTYSHQTLQKEVNTEIQHYHTRRTLTLNLLVVLKLQRTSEETLVAILSMTTLSCFRISRTYKLHSWIELVEERIRVHTSMRMCLTTNR